MAKKLLVFSILFFSICIPAFAIRFEFKYTTGHTYTILSEVQEEVFVNGIKSHDAYITNDISVLESEAQSDGSGRIETSFETTEIASFPDGYEDIVNTQNYFSIISRDRLGNYILDENAFMPVVRNVPVFPDKDIQIGDTWTAQGEEVHDFRESFGIEKPFRIPFIANYKYAGTEIVDENEFHIFYVSYNLIYEPPVQVDNTENTPVLTMVNSNQTLYWDIEKGYLDHYTEDFRIIMETSLGDRIEFIGSAKAQITDFAKREVDTTLEDVQNQIDNLDLDSISAHIAPEGITISLENIQFEPNSAILQESEIIKIQKIAEILKTLPSNDLLISGHTALAGTEQGRKVLSEQRANSVAQELIKNGVRDANGITTQGFGATDPIAPNNSPENMARNRRVEITILNSN